jgi:glycosyltransferase involved in cell wall biosynthesis
MTPASGPDSRAAPVPRGRRRPRRVALLTSARSWRGSTAVFAAVAQALETHGHTAAALVARAEVAREFRARGVAAAVLPVAHTGVRGARALRRALRDLGAEVVFVDKARDVRLAALAFPLGGPAVVYCVSTPAPPRDLLTRLACRRVRVTVFLSDELARRALAQAPALRRAAPCVIPNGVDCDLFRPDAAAGHAFRARFHLGTGPLLVGVGALAPEKRWDLLVDAVALLGPARPPLALCGAGPLADALAGQARARGVDLRLLGRLAPAELVGAYNAATCVVHARPDEVFALALLEALACGRPVLAAAGGGTPELLGEAGALAPPGDAAAFARCLADLLDDAPRRARLAAAARRRAVARFSLERMARDYAALVASLP